MKAFYLLLLSIIRETTQKQLNRRDDRAKKEGYAKNFMPSMGAPFSQHLDVFTNPEVLQTPLFRDFYGGFIT